MTDVPPELDHRRAGPQSTRHPRRARRRADHRRAGRDLRVRPSCFRGHRVRRSPPDDRRELHVTHRQPVQGRLHRALRRDRRPQRGRAVARSLPARCPPTSSPPLGDDEVYVHELVGHARRARRSGELVGDGRRRSTSCRRGSTLDVDARAARAESVMIPYRRRDRRSRVGSIAARARRCVDRRRRDGLLDVDAAHQRRHDLPGVLRGAARR